MLILQLSDDTKARELKPDGNYTKKIPAGDKSINSQEYFMEEAMQNAKIQESVTQGFIGKIKGLASRFYPTW